jgi:AcrR family transcriptional regulator
MTNPERRTLSERRMEELRLKIAGVALDIFVTDCETSATVERIAEAAAVAPRTFYRHFGVKEDVVLPLFRRSSAAIIAALALAPADELPADALVRAFTVELQDGQLSHRERQFLRLMLATPEYRMRWLQVDAELSESIAGFLRERLPLDESPMLLELAADLVVRTARKMVEHWLTKEPDDDLEALLYEGFGLVLGGAQQRAVGAAITHC